jgi:phosphoadenosine phosphosulfate reductase
MNEFLNKNFTSLQNQSAGLSISQTLGLIAKTFAGKTTFSTSFSYEDQVITDFIQKNTPAVSIFTLDTGRLFPEIYNVWSRTNEHYGVHIKPYYPDAFNIEEFVTANGPNAFYESIDLRKSCCIIRKVEPLKRALANNSVWITGLRTEHSASRQALDIIEWDETNNIIKYNPLLYWTTEDVVNYIRENSIPYNVLHDRGFISIGCAPCTRAVKPGEDFRAGRWWWEDADKKECGLHVHATANSN